MRIQSNRSPESVAVQSISGCGAWSPWYTGGVSRCYILTLGSVLVYQVRPPKAHRVNSLKAAPNAGLATAMRICTPRVSRAAKFAVRLPFIAVTRMTTTSLARDTELSDSLLPRRHCPTFWSRNLQTSSSDSATSVYRKLWPSLLDCLATHAACV
jgi:hypothetical protein